MDRLLSSLITRAMRRGFGGEPIWLAVGVTVWLVRRARRKPPPLVWSGRLSPGDRLVISSRGPGTGPSPDPTPAGG